MPDADGHWGLGGKETSVEPRGRSAADAPRALGIHGSKGRGSRPRYAEMRTVDQVSRSSLYRLASIDVMMFMGGSDCQRMSLRRCCKAKKTSQAHRSQQRTTLYPITSSCFAFLVPASEPPIKAETNVALCKALILPELPLLGLMPGR